MHNSNSNDSSIIIPQPEPGTFYAIWGEDKNKAIGKDNKLAWRSPEDMAAFKKITKHSVVIMGRKTFESLPEAVRPLPQRFNVVISSKPQDTSNIGMQWVDSLDAALYLWKQKYFELPCFCLGGASVYKQALIRSELAGIYVTRVNVAVEGADAWAPDQTETFEKLISNPEIGTPPVEFQFWRRKVS